MTKLTEVITELIKIGADPNDLQNEFEEAVSATQEWGLWGDTYWRREEVCSKCGSSYAGICSDKGTTPKISDFNNPAFHKNQNGVDIIPLKDWLLKNGKR